MFFYSPEKIGELTEQMVGYSLTTKQTPPEGVLVKKVTVTFYTLHVHVCYILKPDSQLTCTSQSEGVSSVLISCDIKLLRLNMAQLGNKVNAFTFMVCFSSISGLFGIVIHFRYSILAQPNLSANWAVFICQKSMIIIYRGFIKGRAPGKLTGCERDLAINLPGYFRLLFLLSFIRKTENARLKTPLA